MKLEVNRILDATMACFTTHHWNCNKENLPMLDGVGREYFIENDDDKKNEEGNDSEALRYAFTVYGSIFLIFFLLFCFVRRRYPRIYNVRSCVSRLQCALAHEQYGFFSWTWKLLFVSDDEILEQCGMDAVCFLRVLQIGFQLSLMGVFLSIWLLPIYGTAPSADSTDYIDDRMVRVTVANVPPGSPRLLATVFAAYFLFGYAMYLILNEFEVFTANRIKFLSKAQPRNYSVYVSCIRAELASDAALLAFFRQMFSYDDVLEANVALAIPELQRKVATRLALVDKLEHAINIKEIRRVEPTHLDLSTRENVNSIETYRQELHDLNKDIHDEISRLEKIRGRPVLEENSRESISQTIFCGSYPGQSQMIGEECKEDTEKGLELNDSLAFRNEKRVGTHTILPIAGLSEDSSMVDPLLPLDTDKALEATAASEDRKESKDRDSKRAAFFRIGVEEGAPLSAGFVTFTTLYAANAALQCIYTRTPFQMDVSEAPDPESVLWSNVGKTKKALQAGKLLSFSFTATICIFWTVPVTFLISWTELDSLKQELSFLEDWLDALPWLEPLLHQIGPLLLMFLDSAVLPIVLEQAAKLEGHTGDSFLEASLFVKLSTFRVRSLMSVCSFCFAWHLICCFWHYSPTDYPNLLCSFHCW